MSRTITISLPVTDLQVSTDFYAALGFTHNPQCSGDGAAFMMLSESISLVLLTHDKWRTLTNRPIPPSTSSEVGFAVSCDSRAEVDAISQAAAKCGGVIDINPIEDYDFMYGRDLTDPDGHVWSVKWIDMSAIPSHK